jgi:hypothetical protein
MRYRTRPPHLDESGTLFVSSSVRIIPEEWKENDSIRSLRFHPDLDLFAIEMLEYHDCRNLESVSIPAAVEHIWHGAFSGCTSLTAVIFGPDSSLKWIDGFGKCTSLNRIEIPA